VHRSIAPILLAFAVTACAPEPTPLGMTLASDGVTYAGASVIDITPVITETFTDLNGNHDFDGCLDDPTASRDECDEPFDDVDGDGIFDAVFIGGFGPMRPAQDIHDPVWVRAVVLSHDGEYIAFVAMDFVGLGSPRIHEARDALAADGFDPNRLIAASSHNHQGPDTMGLWGNPEDLDNPTSGRDPAYQQRVAEAIETAVRDAAAAMEPVELVVGKTRMRDRGPWFSGSLFGGKNPTAKMHGMIYDGRDPVLVSDQLLVLQGRTGSSALFTLSNWSGHPEVRGSSNNSISSDWVGVTRDILEAEYGGVALHLPECLGGMQSALGGDVPLVDEDGVHQFDGTVDDDGDDVPVWAEHSSWEFVTSHGWHIAEAAIDALEAGDTIEPSPLTVDVEQALIPIDNIAYQILGPKDLFDLGLEDGVTDPALCPRAGDGPLGCLPTNTFQVRLGPVAFVGVPGELLPELAWGFPDDAAWLAEVDDPTARGDGATYFAQHDSDCDDLDYSECRERTAFGDCDCLKVHAWPYTLSEDPTIPPLLDLLPDGVEHRAVLGMTDNYLSYIIPRPDFNRAVSLLMDEDGDHYEDTVSPSWDFAMELQRAQARIAARAAAE